MPRPRKTATKRTIRPWTATDLRTLRRLAHRAPAARIGRDLKRTESAVRQKACALGLSLQLR
jgi:hypothetical protein